MDLPSNWLIPNDLSSAIPSRDAPFVHRASRLRQAEVKGTPASRDAANSTATELPTGAMLDPAGRSFPVGNMPLSAALAPDGRHLALLSSGWREEGLQIVDVASSRVTQKLPQRGAFLGLAFSTDGRTIYTSGGGGDVVYRYAWSGSAATLTDSIDIAGSAKRGTEIRLGDRDLAGRPVSVRRRESRRLDRQ